MKNVTPESIGFDAAMYFQPNGEKGYFGSKYKEPIVKKLPRLIEKYVLRRPKENPYSFGIKNIHLSYKKYISNFQGFNQAKYKQFPSVFPGWDNSPRKKEKAVIFKESSPELYGVWLKKVVTKFRPFSNDENLIFINAWNEWGEGNHLEPCEKWGYAYLEETKKILNEASVLNDI